jgi:RNA polymerase sigma factor (TIGR02999 family)
MVMASPSEITRLLADWKGGDAAALDRLLPLVYDELRRLARSQMRHERPDHLLQTTALVHEAYLRLVDQRNVTSETRVHFFAVAAQVMRHILVDYARTRGRAKRGRGVPELSLHEAAVISEERIDEILVVNNALEDLTAFDPRKGKVFELRYFGGMSVDETAKALDVSPATVARDWRMAKAWLRRTISEERPAAP